MSFSVYDREVTLCSGDNVIICNIDDDTVHELILPDLKSAKDTTLHNKLDIDLYHTITNVSYSNDGEYFLICTNRKQLCLYRRKNRELFANRTLARAASRVRFTPNNDVVVADKSGDAYLYSSSRPEEEGTALLGHLSMLLDVMVTTDQKYIVTADRDEKIRVSMYPNCYNILSYCLGHEKFVTNIQELPHDKNILVSSGGDGCLKFWDYKSGRELLSIDVNENVKQEDIEGFNKCLEDCELDESVTILPLKHLVVSKIDDSTSLVMTTLFSCKRLFLYNVSGSVETGVTLCQRQAVELQDDPLECLVRDNNAFWTLSDGGLSIYKFDDKQFEKDDASCRLERINESWKTLRNHLKKHTLFPILYKRKFDNVQDYQERKKSRLLSKVSE
ncbi:tRNA (guanine-N(7)-)-methyltransferase non-catalytic subunit wdr4 [Diprion similis]|uniref:tRNA (guanine-N(7)-)-methyltransferase non-catalytic subunit wdr4 n=1 Tax=Diprion similis TaxID=362088 RepID=UPI001EF8D1F6|nr:tRNA (guanine-N(7)-)-methyltransferase non-catalytic subunit wdr4 [Diprion similis]